MTIRETINNELGGDKYSYIEIYDIDTEMLVYKGIAWDYPYDTNYIVKDYQVYNINNVVSFVMWVDFTISDVEDAIDDYMNSLEEDSDIIIIPYDENAELHNTPLGEMTTAQFMEWKKSLGY